MFHRQILFFNCFSKVYRNIVHVEHSDARWSKFNSYAVIPAFKPPLDRTMYSNSLTMIDMTSSIKHQVAGNKTINQQPNIAFMQFKNQLLLENNSSCGTPGIIMKSKNCYIILLSFFTAVRAVNNSPLQLQGDFFNQFAIASPQCQQNKNKCAHRTAVDLQTFLPCSSSALRLRQYKIQKI